MCVNGIVDRTAAAPFDEHRRGDDAGRRAGTADDDDRDELQRLEQQERILRS